MSNDEPLFDSDVDPKRIKSVADGLRRQGEFESARMLDSYAAVLAAAPQPQAAEPKGWMASDNTGRVIDAKAKTAGSRAAATASATAIYSIPLYTHPQPAQDAKLPSDEDFRLHLGELTPAELRAAQAAARYVLAGERAQDAKDAARYRWLRDKSGRAGSPYIRCDDPPFKPMDYWVTAGTADSCIDRAMAKESGNG